MADVDNLEYGKEYLPQIVRQIRSSGAVLIVIGPHWLKDGHKRLQDPKDVLRKEIVEALKSKASVIPTLVGGAQMPPAKKLPTAVAKLVDRHGIALGDVDWARGMQFLFERLQGIVRAGVKPESLPDVHSTLEKMQDRYIALMLPDPKRAARGRRRTRSAGPADAIVPARSLPAVVQGLLPEEPCDFRARPRQSGGFQELSRASGPGVSDDSGREAELYLSNAYNGVGSVTLLRRKPKQALNWIDSALKLVPGHPYALRDRQEALQYLGPP